MKNVAIGKNAVLHKLRLHLPRRRKSATISSLTRTPSSANFAVSAIAVILQTAPVSEPTRSLRQTQDGTWHKIVQSGPTVLEDDVEIQANTCIDRATVGETRIGHGTKIDDLVLIGHACQVGPDSMLCGQTGLAGSTTTGTWRHLRRPGRQLRPSPCRRRHHRHQHRAASPEIRRQIPFNPARPL